MGDARRGGARGGLMLPTFVVYVVSQTVVLRPYVALTQTLVVFLMLTSMLLLSMQYSRQFAWIFGNWRTWVIYVSVAIFFLPNAELADITVILAKVTYLLACTSVLFAARLSAIFVRIADLTVGMVTAIVLLAKAGLLPSVMFEAGDVVKYSAGFTNPNTPSYFLFSAIGTYFLFLDRRRLAIAVAAMVLVTLLGAYSRTYLFGAALLVLVAFGPQRRFWLQMMRWPLASIALLFAAAGCVFFLIAAFYPVLVQPLVMSPLDIVTSLRFSTAIEYMYSSAPTLSGVQFEAQDSMFYEIALVLGPLYTLLFFGGLLVIIRNSMQEPAAHRLLMLAVVVVLTGLMQSMLFSLTPLAVITFSIAFIGRRSYEPFLSIARRRTNRPSKRGARASVPLTVPAVSPEVRVER